jgi:D-alanine-D-alanine ligase
MMQVEEIATIRKIILLYNVDTSWTDADLKYIDQLIERMLTGLQNYGFTVHPIAVYNDLSVLDGYDTQQWLVFNWCEGFAGMPWSDALVAKGLESRGFTFTGSNSKTLAVTQDKWQVKKILQAAGVPTPSGMIMDENSSTSDWQEFPAVVKPVNQHGSFGVTRESVVTSPQELAKQVRWVKKKFDAPALVEPFLDDREFQVAVWGNGKLQVLPPTELDYSAFTELGDRLYTFESKFDPESPGWVGINWLCPAPVEEKLRAELERVALAAYRAVRCRDYARMDIRLFKGRPMILDVNPNPDLDPTSVFPTAAEVAGHDYATMTRRIVELATIRMRRRLSAIKARKGKKSMAGKPMPVGEVYRQPSKRLRRFTASVREIRV